MNSARGPRTYIESHSALRGIAAVVVLVDHLRAFQLVPRGGVVGRALDCFAWDDQAVFLFFVLSGFVMSHVYLNPVQWRHFAVARFARLVPVYEVTLLVFVVLAALVGADRELMTFSNIAANVLMLQVWVPVPGWDSINLPAWSLSVEAFLYVAIFPLLVFLRRASQARSYFAVLLLGGAIWGVCFYNYDRGALFRYWPLPLLCGVGGFMAGFAVRELLANGPLRRPGVVAACSLVLIAAGILNRVVFPGSESHGYMALGFIGLVAASSDPASAVYRALARPALLYLGDISYSLYLWHFCVMMILVRVGAHLDNHLRSAAQHSAYATALACGVVLASFLVATASYRWIEVPFRRLIRDRFVRAVPGSRAAG